MATNGNPIGTRKVAAARDRIKKEQNTLKNVQVFTQDPDQASKVLGVSISNGKVPTELITSLPVEKLEMFRFLVDGVETSAHFVATSLKVIRDCRNVIKRFGG